MARTAQTKTITRTRDIEHARAAIKLAALQLPSPKLPIPAKLAEPPKPAMPSTPPAPVPKPAVANVVPPPPAPAAVKVPTPVPLEAETGLKAPTFSVNPGEPAALPPAIAAPPVAPQPRPMARPAPVPTTSITPQSQIPAALDTAPMPTAQTPATQPPARGQEAAQADTPQKTQPLARQQGAVPATDGHVMNKQLAAAAAGWSEKLRNATNQNAVDAVVKEATPLIEKTLDKNILGQHANALADLRNGKVNTPAVARLMQEQVGPAGEKFMTDAIARSGASDPYGFGAAANAASSAWKSMGQYGQIAFALGVPLTLIGMFGNSGMASMLGLLGLGAAGGLATLGGAFGEEPAKLVEGLLGGTAKTLGINTPSREQYEKRIRNAARISQAAANAEGRKIKAELERWAPYSPSARAGISALGPNPEQTIFDRVRAETAKAVRPAHRLYDYAVPDAVQALPGLARTGLAAMPETARNMLHQYVPQKTIDSTINGINTLVNPTHDDTTNAVLRMQNWKDPSKVENPPPPAGREIRAHVIDIALGRTKLARCWKGYEPVPGKAPYSEDSCRPVGSKKKKKKTEKKADNKLPARPFTLPPWMVESFNKRKELARAATAKPVSTKPPVTTTAQTTR